MAIRRIKCDNSDVFIHHCAAAAHQNRFYPTRFAEMKGKEAVLLVQLRYYKGVVAQLRGRVKKIRWQTRQLA